MNLLKVIWVDKGAISLFVPLDLGWPTLGPLPALYPLDFVTTSRLEMRSDAGV